MIHPAPGRDEAFFWDGVAHGRLLIRRCAQCGGYQHPPVPLCPRCGGEEWAAAEMSGRGTVHSWVLSRPPGAGKDGAPLDDDVRIVALVQLVEGPRLVSNLVGLAPSQVRNELEVAVSFEAIDDVVLPQFRPVPR